MSKSHSSSTQQQQSTEALDPDVKAALLGNYAGLASSVPAYAPYTGDKVAGFTPAQLQAFGLVGNIANGNTGDAALNQGIAAANGAAAYQPIKVSAPTASASLVDTSALPTVTGGALTGVDLSGYINPYVQNVVDTTAAQLEQQRLRDLNSNNQQATLAGAWRGDRAGVADALTNESAQNTLASTTAGLYSQAYQQAAQDAETDLARGLTAQQANQATQAAAATTNAQLGTQASLANASNDLTAQQANQGAGLTAAQNEVAAAGALAGLSQDQLNEALQRAQALGQVGQTQQQQQQAVLDWMYQNNYLNPQQYAVAYQQLKNQTLGLAGDPTLTQSSGSGNSSSTSLSLKV